MTFAQKMEQYMDRYCELYRFSGMLRITHKDKIIYERNEGYADIEHKVPFELHIYPDGRHGLGLAEEHEDIRTWTDNLAIFLKKQGFNA